MSRKKQKRKCPVCNSPVSKGSKTGYCKGHIKEYLMESSGKRCKTCGIPLAPHNGSGRCKVHFKHFRKSTFYTNYQKSRKPKKAIKPGVCHMPGCGAKFWLESWQHSKIHYCPSCRRGEAYRGYPSMLAICRQITW